MTKQLSENQPKYNPLAIIAFCLGVVPLLYVSAGLAELTDLLIGGLLPVLLLGGCAVAVGAVGLKQIKTTRQRGRGLAIAGCVAGAAVFAILAFIFVYLMVEGMCGLPDGCEG